MANKITIQDNAHFAIANSYNLQISTKTSVEIASFIRGKEVTKAKNLLKEVLQKKIAVPYKRYNDNVPHRRGKGIAAGRYPQKTTEHFLALINTAEANAQDKGLDVNNLVISEIKANQGTRQMHPGRHSRRVMKRTHLRIRVEEKQKWLREK